MRTRMLMMACLLARSAAPAGAAPLPYEHTEWPAGDVDLRRDSSPRLVEDCRSVAEWRMGVNGLLSDARFIPQPGTLRIPAGTGMYRYFASVDLGETPVLEIGVRRSSGKWSVDASLVESCWKAGARVFESPEGAAPGIYRIPLARITGWKGTAGSIGIAVNVGAGAEVDLGFLRLRRDPAAPPAPEPALRILRVDRRTRRQGDRALYTLTPLIRSDRSYAGMLSLEVLSLSGSKVASTQRKAALKPGENALPLSYALPLERTWTPEHPHRLRARIRFRGPAGACERTVRAGQPVLELAGGRLLVNGKDTIIRGMGYSPREGRWPLPNPEAVIAGDFRALRRMGCNAIKQWGRCPDAMLALAEEHGMFVLEGIGVCYDYPAPKHDAFVEARGDELAAILRAHRDSPAILCEAFGYELYGDDRKICQYVEALQQVARREAPEVLTTYAGLPNVIGWQLPVDIGSIQIYCGHDTKRLREELVRYRKSLAGRPLLVAEYGHHSRHVDPLLTYRAWQAEGNQMEWRTLLDAGAIGGFVFMWDDRGRPGKQADDKESFFGINDAADRPKMAYYFVGEMFGGFRMAEAPQRVTWPRDAVVLVSKSAPPALQWAAEDLVRTLPGARLAPSPEAPAPGPRILLGTPADNPSLRPLLAGRSLRAGEGLIRVRGEGGSEVVALAGGDAEGAALAAYKYLYLGWEKGLQKASGAPLTFEAADCPRSPIGEKRAWLVPDRAGAAGQCVAFDTQYTGVNLRGRCLAAGRADGPQQQVYLWIRVDHAGPAYYFINRGLSRYVAVDGAGEGWQWVPLRHATGPDQADGVVWESDDLDFDFYLRAHRAGKPVFLDTLVVTPDAEWKP